MASLGAFNLENKIVTLKWGRLGCTPPARYAAEILAESGFPIVCVEFGNIEEPQMFVERLVPRIRVASRWAKFLPHIIQPLAIVLNIFANLIASILKNGRPKLFIAQGLQEQLICLMLNKLFKIPYAVQVHEPYDGSELSFNNRFFFRFEGPALRNASFLIFPERNRADLYRARYRFKCPWFLVYNSARANLKYTPKDPRKLFRLPKDAFVLGYVGGVGPLNMPESAIDGLVGAPHAHLVLWGWGEDEYIAKLKTRAARAGVLDRTHFAGVLDEQKWDLIAGLDASYCVYVGDHLRERYQATASNKLMESLALGVPVLTTNQPDFSDIVYRHKVGICMPTVNGNAVASAIEQLSRDKIGAKRMSRNGVKLHQLSFNYDHQFQIVVKHLKRMFPELVKPAKKRNSNAEPLKKELRRRAPAE